MPVFASVQFSNVVPSETPLWFQLAPMYLLLISSHVTRNHGYISYQRYIESEGRWLIQGFVTLGCGASLFMLVLADGLILKESNKRPAPWGRRAEEELPRSAGGYCLYRKPTAGLTNPRRSPHSRCCVPVGHPRPGSWLDTGFSLEISGNGGWSSSEAAVEAHRGAGLAASLSVCMEMFGSGF